MPLRPPHHTTPHTTPHHTPPQTLPTPNPPHPTPPHPTLFFCLSPPPTPPPKLCSTALGLSLASRLEMAMRRAQFWKPISPPPPPLFGTSDEANHVPYAHPKATPPPPHRHPTATPPPPHPHPTQACEWISHSIGEMSFPEFPDYSDRPLRWGEGGGPLSPGGGLPQSLLLGGLIPAVVLVPLLRMIPGVEWRGGLVDAGGGAGGGVGGGPSACAVRPRLSFSRRQSSFDAPATARLWPSAWLARSPGSGWVPQSCACSACSGEGADGKGGNLLSWGSYSHVAAPTRVMIMMCTDMEYLRSRWCVCV